MDERHWSLEPSDEPDLHMLTPDWSVPIISPSPPFEKIVQAMMVPYSVLYVRPAISLSGPTGLELGDWFRTDGGTLYTVTEVSLDLTARTEPRATVKFAPGERGRTGRDCSPWVLAALRTREAQPLTENGTLGFAQTP